MVTHDIALASYGDRIIKVVDGKINSEIPIDIDVKSENIVKLQERLSSNSLREGARSKQDSNLIPNQDDNLNLGSKTFVRKPEDYAIKRKSLVK